MAADTRSMHSLAYISCLLAHACVHRTSYMRHAHARMSHILASCIRMYITFTSHHIYMCALFMCACVHASTPCVCVMDIMPRIYPCTLMPTLHIPNAPPWEHTLVDATIIHMQHHGHILTHALAQIHTHDVERLRATTSLSLHVSNFDMSIFACLHAMSGVSSPLH